jgi:uncharacterized cupredoxin-like copper-binding protein
MSRLPVLGLALALVVAAVLAAPGGAAAPSTRVVVTMTDYKFALSKKTVKRGVVRFQVVNKGEVVHDFKITRKKTPIYATGKGGVLRVVFTKPGRYPFLCTIPGHAEAGMKGVLKVV